MLESAAGGEKMKLINADDLMRRVWYTELGPHPLSMVLAEVLDEMPEFKPQCDKEDADTKHLCPWCCAKGEEK